MTTTAPHYPTTAELAAFRRAAWDGDGDPFAGHVTPEHDAEGAWPDELAHGIGYSVADGMPRGLGGDESRYDAWFARYSADWQRTRAYGRLPDTAATEVAMETFAPGA